MLKEAKARIGRNAILLAMFDGEEELEITRHLDYLSWRYCKGKVGSMELQKIVAAIETAAKRNHVVDGELYREMHALYHAVVEAVQGVTRGQVELGDLMRTVGLRFAVVRGTPYENAAEGEWIAVALYGTIGAPIRGLEHETVGLGINHI
ncbi:hut operon transcriptional regulator HutP [Saccharococcus caldoxylosilyticus]|jgi:hut operon positive regulatory protein|uniref:Hut operon positive regulatory protein n=1 Tax=Parageobacillus caldoxylosilyticus NBRC 107762 TaxID=1220594 RepID=A0A023DK25_9BACL|nr:hut operon transcriptional regulator HutP [Parageobacillus caldoxylosilyticus]OQP02290.1 transcriptional regulator [Geobacillus sp. 44B]MBB3852105.1 hut operon positive regulator [Parageobacillus caldoxylosilyticus]QNU38392.1 hut operon transcriptional regulator HutP [Geobacillus sp. 44B]QXJ38068.1 Hut operon positive regulatory protein [Parageobacillus caldoxylosilyticus]BDG34457.1 Hut operon positive regulatory protein [Parageobacillus caldoxylosilyticus]